MLFSLSRFTLEITRGSLYVRLGGREWWVTRERGQPLSMFTKEHNGQELELWGFGLHAVISWG